MLTLLMVKDDAPCPSPVRLRRNNQPFLPIPLPFLLRAREIPALLLAMIHPSLGLLFRLSK